MADDTTNDALSEELWGSLAAMESRITVLESQVEELVQVSAQSRDESMMRDAILDGDDAYICMRYARGEPCIYENRMRRIGFDICFANSCQWILKLE